MIKKEIQKNTIKNKKDGITLIALVITIIVLLILAGVTIATLTGDNGLLGKTTEAQFKSEIKQYEEELRLSINAEEIEALGNRIDTINVFKKFPSTGEENENFEQEMKENIPSFDNAKYGNKLEIRNDELIYTGEENSQERKWFGEVQLSLAKYFITVNYVDKQGNKLAEPETKSTTTGIYEIEPKVIDGYEAERPLYEGKTKEDTEITITYLQESRDLAYIGLDSNGNETEDESKIVAYTVSGIGNFTGTDLVIPRKYNNKPVTQIKANAFQANRTIIKAIIQDTVEKIKDSAFRGCSNLEEATINPNTIDKLVFYNCTNLSKAVIGQNVTSMSDQIFLGSKLSDLTILTEKTNVNNGNLCISTTLKEVKVNVNNQKYKVEDGIVYSKDGSKIYMYPPGHEGTTYIFNNNIKTIGDNAFFGCSKLTSIVIPETIELVQDSAFRSCSNLEEVTINAKDLKRLVFYQCSMLSKAVIGENVTSMSDQIFFSSNLSDLTILTEKANISNYNLFATTTLKEVKVNTNNQKYKVEDGILYSKDGSKICMYPPGHEGTTHILNNNIKTIGDSAFLGCSKLTSIVIPETIELVENSAFMSCSNLEEVTINAETINRLVFYGCSKLKKAIIGENVKKFAGDSIFLNDNLLTQIEYEGTKEEWNAITKVSSWKTGSRITSITCKDETITL